MKFLKTIISKLGQGLAKRDTFVSGLRSVLLGRKLDEELIQEIERRLLQADVGVQATAS
ncbi:MAG: signal recognition particle receptor subunit alpha [Phycisphaeraceae bacterium]|nr:signal recognition particle receptor subunit alpha [Phycisphaeraceae bacterium]